MNRLCSNFIYPINVLFLFLFRIKLNNILELGHLLNQHNPYRVIIGKTIRLPGLEPYFPTHRLYDLGQVTSLLCASMFPYVKWL